MAGTASIEAGERRVVVRAGDSDAVALALLTRHGARDLEVGTASLEDAFVQLTQETR